VKKTRYFDVIRTLNAYDVRYILIGGLAAILWGSDHITSDIDICYDRERENVKRLVQALHEMEAHLRGYPAGLPEIIDERAFRLGDTMTFETKYAWFDCLGLPLGNVGYKQLATNATKMAIEDDLIVAVASIDDIIQMKRAAGRAKDLGVVEQLKRLKQIREDLAASGEKPAGED
jgi:hypothetical protein